MEELRAGLLFVGLFTFFPIILMLVYILIIGAMTK